MHSKCYVSRKAKMIINLERNEYHRRWWKFDRGLPSKKVWLRFQNESRVDSLWISVTDGLQISTQSFQAIPTTLLQIPYIFTKVWCVFMISSFQPGIWRLSTYQQKNYTYLLGCNQSIILYPHFYNQEQFNSDLSV